MSYYRVNYNVESVERTVIIEAPNMDTAMFNARAVLMYDIDDGEPVERVSDIRVFPALPGEEEEYDHIHANVEDLERVMADVRAKIAAKVGTDVSDARIEGWEVELVRPGDDDIDIDDLIAKPPYEVEHNTLIRMFQAAELTVLRANAAVRKARENLDCAEATQANAKEALGTITDLLSALTGVQYP